MLSQTLVDTRINALDRNDVTLRKSQHAVETVPNKPTQWSLIPVLPFYEVKKFNSRIVLG